MSDDCLSREELLEALEAADSRQHPHLKDCVRCRARLASLRSFLEEGQEEPGMRLKEADRVLNERLDREIHGEKAPSLLTRLGRSWMVPAAAALALLALVIIVQQGGDPLREPPETGALRGEHTVSGSAAALVEGDEMVFRWTDGEAESLLLTLYGEDLRLCGETRAAGASEIRLPLDSPLLEGVAFWCLSPLAAADVREPTALLPLPR